MATSKVYYYSGSKGDEYPRYFYWSNKKYFVKKVLSEENILDINTGKQIRRFLVETEEGKKFQIEEKEGKGYAQMKNTK